MHTNAPEMRLYDLLGQRLYVTNDERVRLLSRAQNAPAPFGALVHVLAFTGCRLSEALALTPKRIDPQAGVIIFESLKKRREGVFRAVPVPPALFEALTPLLECTGSHRRLIPIHRATAWRHMRVLMSESQIIGAHATPKGLRHGFGVYAVQCGIPLNLVQKWLGHAHIKTTAIYANAIGAEEHQIAMKMWNK